MSSNRLPSRAWARQVTGAALCILVAASALAGPCADDRETSAQAIILPQQSSDIERDVPYVPTRDAVVDAMLDLAGVGPDDVVIDLGSGDGRIVIAAARDHGARGIGVEIDPALVEYSRQAAIDAGVADLVEFRIGNLFEADLSEVSVVAIFLGVDENLALRPRLLSELDPGDRVVSNVFTMGEWLPDRSIESTPHPFFLYSWDVPAQVKGRWEWESPVSGEKRKYTTRFLQQFQELHVGALADGYPVTVRESTLSGDRIVIEIVDTGGSDDAHAALLRYEGVVAEDGLIRGEVVVSVGGDVRTEPWSARRVPTR